jgi:hypothetical protein
MKNVQKINQTELVNLLSNLERGQFVNLFIVTKVAMNKFNRDKANKKPNPFLDQILKLNCFNAIVGNSYETRVFTETQKLGLPMPDIKENKVGNHVSKVLLYNENKNSYYLQYEKPKNYVSRALYFFKNSLITKDKFFEFMPEKKYDPNKPVFLSVKIENIKSITIHKIKYIVE